MKGWLIIQRSPVTGVLPAAQAGRVEDQLPSKAVVLLVLLQVQEPEPSSRRRQLVSMTKHLLPSSRRRFAQLEPMMRSRPSNASSPQGGGQGQTAGP